MQKKQTLKLERTKYICINKRITFIISKQTTATIQVTSSLVVTSDKINACSVYTQQAYLRAARVSVAPRPRDQLNAQDADVTSLPNWYWLGSYRRSTYLLCKLSFLHVYNPKTSKTLAWAYSSVITKIPKRYTFMLLVHSSLFIIQRLVN